MAISVFNDFFRIISDGEKIVFLRAGCGGRECIIYANPYLTRFDINMHHMTDVTRFGEEREYVPGLIDYRVDLSLQGGMIQYVEKPLVMGVDLFSRLSITDYLDIINEKIKRRPQ